MSSPNEKPDIDEIDPAKLFSPSEIENESLQDGINALSGKKVSELPKKPSSVKEKSPSTSPKKESKKSSPISKKPEPVEKTDDSSSSSNESEGELELSQLNNRISALYSQLKLQKKHNAGLSEALRLQGEQLNGMDNFIAKQEARIKVLESELSFYKDDYKTNLKDLEEKFNAKHAETVRVMHETPDLVERLVQSTNQIMSHLPEETKKTLKRVELTEPEKVTVSVLRSQTAIPKKKLPKHAR